MILNNGELYFCQILSESAFFAAEINFLEQNCVRALEPSLRTL